MHPAIRIAFALSLGGLGGVGLRATRSESPDPLPCVEAPSRKASETERSFVPSTTGVEPASTTPSTSSERFLLDLEIAFLRGQLKNWEGAPVDWPEDLPDHLAPESLATKAPARLSAEGATFEAMDCAEYPCIVSFKIEADDEADTYRECVSAAAALTEPAPFQPVSPRIVRLDSDGNIRCLVSAARAADRTDQVLRKRLDHRMGTLQTALGQGQLP